MKYYIDEELSRFPFWSGAKTNVENLTEEELNNIGDELEATDMFGGEIPSDVQINDLFWFDFPTVLSLIGLTEEELDERNEQ